MSAFHQRLFVVNDEFSFHVFSVHTLRLPVKSPYVCGKLLEGGKENKMNQK